MSETPPPPPVDTAASTMVVLSTEGASMEVQATSQEEQDSDSDTSKGKAAADASLASPAVRFTGVIVGQFVQVEVFKRDTGEKVEDQELEQELAKVGIYQRDIAAREEVLLSLEQAFFLMEDLKVLEVYVPRDTETTEGEVDGPLSCHECWRRFSLVAPSFKSTVGAYRYYRHQGFVVHGGLNLGVDLLLYRGSPQRFHSEFAVTLRFAELGMEALEWREVHLLFRLIQEVRKTLVVAHVHLGPDQQPGEAEGPEHAVAAEMARWYYGFSVYEVVLSPWRIGTPLEAKSRNSSAIVKSNTLLSTLKRRQDKKADGAAAQQPPEEGQGTDDGGEEEQKKRKRGEEDGEDDELSKRPALEEAEEEEEVELKRTKREEEEADDL